MDEGHGRPARRYSLRNIAVVDRSKLQRTVGGTAVGNFMEWYDFGIFGFLATTIAMVFFPSGSGLALVATFGAFAVSFLVRPDRTSPRHGHRQHPGTCLLSDARWSSGRGSRALHARDGRRTAAGHTTLRSEQRGGQGHGQRCAQGSGRRPAVRPGMTRRQVGKACDPARRRCCRLDRRPRFFEVS